MDQSEFERRKRHLEADLEAGIELLRAGFRAQMRALEALWLGSPAHVSPFPAATTPPAPPARAEPLLPPASKRRPAGELRLQVHGLFDVLPEVFDRNDLVARLGYKPKRNSLNNVLEELLRDGAIVIAERGRGMSPTRYRRVSAAVPDTSEA